jgi:hypothetical protein
MELDALILAEAVSATPDGNFFIHGGGFSRYEVPALPFPIPLGVLVRLAVDDDEIRGVAHHFRVAFIGPTGHPNIPPIEFDSEPTTELSPLLEGEQRYLQIALRFGAVIVRQGLHLLELAIDGDLIKSIPVPVTVMEGPAEFPPEREWPALDPGEENGPKLG